MITRSLNEVRPESTSGAHTTVELFFTPGICPEDIRLAVRLEVPYAIAIGEVLGDNKYLSLAVIFSGHETSSVTPSMILGAFKGMEKTEFPLEKREEMSYTVTAEFAIVAHYANALIKGKTPAIYVIRLWCHQEADYFLLHLSIRPP